METTLSLFQWFRLTGFATIVCSLFVATVSSGKFLCSYISYSTNFPSLGARMHSFICYKVICRLYVWEDYTFVMYIMLTVIEKYSLSNRKCMYFKQEMLVCIKSNTFCSHFIGYVHKRFCKVFYNVYTNSFAEMFLEIKINSLKTLHYW